jgi:hypothetical protein
VQYLGVMVTATADRVHRSSRARAATGEWGVFACCFRDFWRGLTRPCSADSQGLSVGISEYCFCFYGVGHSKRTGHTAGCSAREDKTGQTSRTTTIYDCFTRIRKGEAGGVSAPVVFLARVKKLTHGLHVLYLDVCTAPPAPPGIRHTRYPDAYTHLPSLTPNNSTKPTPKLTIF